MHFSLVKSLYKNQVIWDYMTKKSPDFSQKVWLLFEREIVVGNGCCFSVWSQTMSRLLHKGEGFGGRNREGRVIAQGRGSVRKCADFAGKQ